MLGGISSLKIKFLLGHLQADSGDPGQTPGLAETFVSLFKKDQSPGETFVGILGNEGIYLMESWGQMKNVG